MAHVEKFAKTSLGHMLKHYERSAENYSNESIDKSRTGLNYNLAPRRNMSQLEYIKKRCSEVKCLKRDDVKVMCTWVVTAPKDLDPKQQEQFFKETYKFLEQRYGVENVVSSYVHLDEKTPHMHFAFVPVATDFKKDIKKVSAKLVVSRSDLRTFHTDLQKHLDKANIWCNVLNEATKDGNKSIMELKRGTAIEEVSALEKSIEALREDLKDMQEVTALIGDVDDIKAEKGLLGRSVKINERDYDKLIKTSKKAIALLDKVSVLERQRKGLLNKVYRLENEVDTLKDVKKDNTELKGKNRLLLEQKESLLNQCKAFDKVCKKHNLIEEAKEEYKEIIGEAPEPKNEKPKVEPKQNLGIDR